MLHEKYLDDKSKKKEEKKKSSLQKGLFGPSHFSFFSLSVLFQSFHEGSSLAEYKGGRAREYRNMTANWRGVIRLLKGLGGGENQIR